ncbi:Na+/H+ antiporter NhaC family protein [Thalassotalea sp. G20_0]|uniref:Na+/H+ antiporter NhaC family protein n=1 Tax=Thalassotalea sp. G20_0 TaxID=2821093 RepID=UPI001ADA8280|nr:Na+/H+ antiporter NhaC family protein [Thalassotalea sp. G20_0]MBO9492669.1 Na+/H+ antiporter NhaC family protein [Thalassotalea sp. G20_0]
MELTSFSDSSLSLLAPAIAIILAVITRKVLWSLGAGIVTGALLLTGLNPLITIHRIFDGFVGVFWDEGLNFSNLYILLFLLVLGVITSLISISGGARAFGEWARERVKTRQGSQVLTVFLGVIIFIDDYFNSLAVGSISKPLTDRHKVSRAKLAYLIDSTAAPICVIMPISSWGAYIIALVGTIMATHGVGGDSPVFSFLAMVPMNLYAIFALALVFFTAAMDLNVGPMARHESAALAGTLFDANKGNPPGAPSLEEDKNGRVADLVSPILVLVLATMAAMIWTGYTALAGDNQAFSILGAFENTDVTLSLISGGMIGLLFAIARLLGRNISGNIWKKAIAEGSRSMLPAIYILVFAWVLTGIIGQLETGKYLAGLVSGNISPSFLPMMLFIVSGVMAFATGTSWGTFGIMLPIAGDMAAAADIAMMLPMLASVLAGAVFGDHCSPISDTTILSSTGASCHHMDHVNTQLPYALAIAAVAMFGYLVMGITHSISLGFVASLVAFTGLVILFRRISLKSRLMAPASGHLAK